MSDHPAQQLVVDLVPEVPLPVKARVLYVHGGQQIGSWLVQHLEQSGCVELSQVQGTAAALGTLAEVPLQGIVAGHEPSWVHGPELTKALRLRGYEGAVIILGNESPSELAVACYESGADEYLCVPTSTGPMLLWVLRRALARVGLTQKCRQLEQFRTQALQQERTQAQALLDHQQQLACQLSECESQLDPSPPGTVGWWGLGAVVPLPQALHSYYRELLRSYVVLGAGTLQEEVSQLALTLARLRLPVQRVVELHRSVLAQMLQGRGNRSCRHLLARADMLLVELLAHLARCFRSWYAQAQRRPVQLWLPGLDPLGAENERACAQ